MPHMKENPLKAFFTFSVSSASAYFLTPILWPLLGYQIDPLTYFFTFLGTGILMIFAVYPAFKMASIIPRFGAKAFFPLVACAASSYFLTPTLCERYEYQLDPVAYIATFLGTGIFILFVIYPAYRVWDWRSKTKAANKHEARKFNENVSLRIVKGSFINLFIAPSILFIVWRFGFNILNRINPNFFSRIIEFNATLYDIIILIPFLSITFGAIGFMCDGCPQPKEWFGKTALEFIPRRYKFGRGGSASFGGILEDWASRYKKGMILIGASLYEPLLKIPVFKNLTYKVGCINDLHLITIASNRGGKGRSAIIPNLIEWPHSALVIDPKGTNAAVTAARRGRGGGRVNKHMGQNVYIIDPFHNFTKDSSCFNPLESIDIESNTIVEDIGLVSDALILPENTTVHGDHFRVNAIAIISGIIAHLLTKNKKASLIDVRNILILPPEEKDRFFSEMQENEKAGGLSKAAVEVIKMVGGNEMGGFFSTILKNTNWIDSLAMKKVLSYSSFNISELKNGKTTIYVILPPHLLEDHKRFMRLFVNMSILEMSKGEKAKNPVLFVLDEFFSLGTLSQLEKAAGLLASYNVKLWPIVQNLGQLKKNYPENWDTFFSNAGIEQYFAISGSETLEFLKDRLSKTAYGQVVMNLRETSELEEELARDKNRQLVLRSGKRPLLLRRTNYDTIFSKDMYSPDPDHPNS